ncbi:hypothetical protein HDZ31DRAFT_69982 [Schizophyllum fasciatum]
MDTPIPRPNLYVTLNQLQMQGARVKRALYRLLDAHRVAQTCSCGKMAWGRATPCEHLVCGTCVCYDCPSCRTLATVANASCAKHEMPVCPHPRCRVLNKPVKSFYPIGGIGRELHGVMRTEAGTLEHLLDDIDNLVDVAFER